MTVWEARKKLIARLRIVIFTDSDHGLKTANISLLIVSARLWNQQTKLELR